MKDQSLMSFPDLNGSSDYRDISAHFDVYFNGETKLTPKGIVRMLKSKVEQLKLLSSEELIALINRIVNTGVLNEDQIEFYLFELGILTEKHNQFLNDLLQTFNIEDRSTIHALLLGNLSVTTINNRELAHRISNDIFKFLLESSSNIFTPKFYTVANLLSNRAASISRSEADEAYTGYDIDIPGRVIVDENTEREVRISLRKQNGKDDSGVFRQLNTGRHSNGRGLPDEG